MNQKLEGSSPKVRFTYMDKINYFQSQARPSPHQLSASYTTSYVPRAASLPHQTNVSKYKTQQKNHIKYLENSSYMQRSRKHKIFEQSPLLNRQTHRKSKVESRIENAQYKTNISPNKTEKAMQTITVLTLDPAKSNQKKSSVQSKINSNSKINELDIQEINHYIDRRLLQKLSQIDSIKGDKSMRSSTNNQQLRKKQQQIIYLKMEVQRLRRCEKINKQNQSLYLRLVAKLKDSTHRSKQQSLYSTSKRQKQGILSLRENKNQTPMNELLDLKKIQEEKPPINQENIVINKRINQAAKQSINNTSFVQKNSINDPKGDMQRGKQSGVSKAVTFNNSKEAARAKSHSRRVNLDIQRSMIEMQQKVLFNQTQNKTFSDLPISNRLEQINNQLERRLSRRSASKQKKQYGTSSSIYGITTSQFNRQNHKYQVYMY